MVSVFAVEDKVAKSHCKIRVMDESNVNYNGSTGPMLRIWKCTSLSLCTLFTRPPFGGVRSWGDAR